MLEPLPSGLYYVGGALLLGGPYLLLFYYLWRRRAAVGAWERSPEGQRLREALNSWLLGKACLVQAEPTGEPVVVRATLVRRGKSTQMVREERQPMRLRIRLLPIGGEEVSSEAVVSIPTTELADLTPGRIFSVLYDPGDPRRFYVDSVRRDGTFIDGATIRTRAAEDNLRAAQAFAAGPR